MAGIFRTTLVSHQGKLRHQLGKPGRRPGDFLAVSSRPSRSFGCSRRSASVRAGTGPFNCRVASVTDGTSNTHFVSELLQGAHGRHPRHDVGRQRRCRLVHDAVRTQRLPGLCRRHLAPWIQRQLGVLPYEQLGQYRVVRRRHVRAPVLRTQDRFATASPVSS